MFPVELGKHLEVFFRVLPEICDCYVVLDLAEAAFSKRLNRWHNQMYYVYSEHSFLWQDKVPQPDHQPVHWGRGAVQDAGPPPEPGES